MKLHSSGYVTTPLQPSFSAYLSSHKYPTAGQRIAINPWTERHDNGSNFNSTTGVYTAPVSGKYFFYISCMVSRNDNGDFQISIYKNGTLYVNSNDMSTAATTTYQQTTVNAVMNVSANDTIDFRLYNSSGTATYLYQSTYTHCGGYLIG
tara:strand:- start:331 stop:780 length:450 start_codon:yes stop_codon:yes gene_type:complete